MFAGDKLNIIDYYNNNFFIIKNKNLKINPALQINIYDRINIYPSIFINFRYKVFITFSTNTLSTYIKI